MNSLTYGQKGECMAKGLTSMGTAVAILGVSLAMASIVGTQYIISEYQKKNPDDTNGPCLMGNLGRPEDNIDWGACNALQSFQTLAWPGWILLFIGIGVSVTGKLLEMRRTGYLQRSSQQVPHQQVPYQEPHQQESSQQQHQPPPPP